MDYRKCHDVAVDAAQVAGKIIMEAWDKPRSVQQKAGAADLVRYHVPELAQ
jgi:hypothetical protein